MDTWVSFFLHATALSYAIVGGVFLAFSDFIMRALANTPGTGGLAAMQEINRSVFRWVLIGLFLGLAPVSLALAGLALFTFDGPARALTASAGGLYLTGCFGVTALGNVPLNTTLGRHSPAATEAQTYWKEIYLPVWTRLNTVRTLACVAAAALMLAAGSWPS